MLYFVPSIRNWCPSRAFRLIVTAAVLFAAHTCTAADTETARYRVTFDATWSAATHPTDFPPSAHWSGLIGGTHDASTRFWEPGRLASEGIEVMAELGGRTELRREVQAAITAGSAFSVIEGNGVPRSPGSVSTTFEIRATHPLATVTTMVAPSPDWFVGVSGYNLRANDRWIGKAIIELFPYDAGTDSGPMFTSSDHDTNPPEPIRPITGYPFEGTGPMGTFTYLRLLDGDFNESGTHDGEDIDTLSRELRTGTAQIEFDLNRDQVVDQNDRVYWVESLARTYFGDSNLDGQFDTADLVAVFQRGEYEDNIPGNSRWDSGDWDGDADFTTGDLVLAFQHGGYELGPRGAAAQIPEPASTAVLTIADGWVVLLGRRRLTR